MSSPTFLVINDQPISVEQVLDFLREAGTFPGVLRDILRQHAIAQELQLHPELRPTAAILEQVLEDFRREKQLLDNESFQAWIRNNGIDYETLCQQLIRTWRLQQLKILMSHTNLHEHFIQRKQSLDRFTLSWIMANNRGLAEELYDQITGGETSFEQLVKEYAFKQDRENHGWMKTFSRGELRNELKEAMKTAQPGQIISPLVMNDRWCLVRVENITNVSFKDVKEQLQTELYEEWLTKQVEAMTVKLEVTRWLYLQASTP
jgi:parvulin-like peptidyl-prolyl isomerase